MERSRAILALAVCAVGMSGCESGDYGGAIGLPPGHRDFSPPPELARAVDRIATATVLPSDRSPRNFAAVGFVLINKATDRERAVSTCQKLFAILAADEEVNRRGVASSKRIPTFWPTQTIPDKLGDCDELVRLYDYTRADMIASAAQVTGRAGPVLIAWPGMPNAPTGDILIFDLSAVPTTDLLDPILSWQLQVAADPNSWNGAAWQVEKLRLSMKSFVDAYGKNIVSSVGSVVREIFK